MTLHEYYIIKEKFNELSLKAENRKLQGFHDASAFYHENDKAFDNFLKEKGIDVTANKTPYFNK